MMPPQPILIDGQWQPAQSPVSTFQPMNPTTKTPLDDSYPVSSAEEIERVVRASYQAVQELRTVSPEQIADFLETYAANIEKRAPELVELAYTETALPRDPRLNSVELPRTTGQLRQAAAAVRARDWKHATIDTKLNIRSMYAPLGGAVVVFGPNNFPFAFNGVSGGDFAAAIAAGNPVIAKANPAHPGTTRLLADAALEAIQSCGMPRALVQMIYHMTPEVGQQLVGHPLIGATGFTGSRFAGMQLKAAAEKAGKPIYLEMSSVNPVVILPGALRERADKIADEFTASCTMGAGQFCTNPGLVILLESAESEAFFESVADRFRAARPGILLSQRGPGNIAQAIDVWQQHGAQLVVGGHEVEDSGFSFENTLLRASGQQFLENPDALQTEAFGATSLYVFAADESELERVLAHLEGNLTGCIYSDTAGADDALYQRIEPLLRARVGRLLNDKLPTGVAVSPAMNHGGPYPSTGHPGFTAVGIPASITRFAALYSYDNVRPHRLPPELQDRNPTGKMWRFINNQWSQADVPP
ncbi:MAG: aldehyde dehydrogenase (NADP(+)), partial [Anaerolineae bacterium]|nr:aldehyde dehydrogenase (NADP(+)) [Anaerolineae bacterium]